MFRLEKLEISGFKSFADRTSLVFGEGITGVVGPNGCGKSNIAEAISWVLGEQSAKNLRGGKMEDVIFNGTRDRKPNGMAEVLLTLIAIEDIVAREVDEGDGVEAEFDEAVSHADHADKAARALVQEMSPAEAETQRGGAESAEAAQRSEADAKVVTHPEIGAAFTANPVAGEGEAPGTARDSESQAVEGEAAVPQASAAEAAASEAGSAGPAQKPKRQRSAPPRRKGRSVAISAGERVTVGRRLYRTGDSDYLMNGRACLLRDIQDLFAGTGLGGSHYAIIEQGRIGQILSSKPLDRRGLIEEAAGITKFKSRKRAAELKLESAKQNLTRLNDIISEIERQVNSLKRQAQKARRYKRLREEMRGLLKLVFTADYYRLNEASERIAAGLAEAEVAQKELDAKLLGLETEYRAASVEARGAEDALAELKERAAAVELEADRARNRRAFDETQIAELSARIQEIERDQKTLDERLTLLDGEAQKRGEALKLLDAELTDSQAALFKRESEYAEELARLRAAEAEIEKLRQKMLSEIGITERVRNLSSNLEDALRRLDLRQTNLRNEAERAAARLDQASTDHSSLQSEVEGDKARLTELGARIAERATELNAVGTEAAAVRSELAGVRTQRAAAAHRLTSLDDLDAHHAYYSDAVQHVLSPEQAARINALGTLADFVEVEPHYERLVESLFGRELQCVLAPTIDDALAGVEYIKSEGLGAGAFLVVGLHGGEDDSWDGVVDGASSGDEPHERPDAKSRVDDEAEAVAPRKPSIEAETLARLMPGWMAGYIPPARQLALRAEHEGQGGPGAADAASDGAIAGGSNEGDGPSRVVPEQTQEAVAEAASASSPDQQSDERADAANRAMAARLSDGILVAPAEEAPDANGDDENDERVAAASGDERAVALVGEAAPEAREGSWEEAEALADALASPGDAGVIGTTVNAEETALWAELDAATEFGSEFGSEFADAEPNVARVAADVAAAGKSDVNATAGPGPVAEFAESGALGIAEERKYITTPLESDVVSAPAPSDEITATESEAVGLAPGSGATGALQESNVIGAPAEAERPAAADQVDAFVEVGAEADDKLKLAAGHRAEPAALADEQQNAAAEPVDDLAATAETRALESDPLENLELDPLEVDLIAASLEAEQHAEAPDAPSPDANPFGEETDVLGPESRARGLSAEEIFDREDERDAARFELEVLRAINLLGLKPELKSVVERAFPEKCAACVVPDIEAALQLSIENSSRIYVTLDGEQVVNGRLFVTGAQAGQRGASLLQLKREIKQLRSQTQELSGEEERLAASLNQVEQSFAGLEAEAKALDRELRQHEKAAAARDSQLAGLARELERAEQHVRVVEAEAQQAAEERVDLESRIAVLATELAAAEASRDAVQAALTAAQSALLEMRVRVEQLSEELSSSRASVAARAERLQAAKAELRRIDNETEELRSRINRNRLELYESHGRMEQLTASQAECNSVAARHELEQAALAEQIAAAAAELAASRARTDELEGTLAELRQAASAAHERRGQIEVEKARVEADAEHLTRDCVTELAMALEDVVTSVELGGQFAQGFAAQATEGQGESVDAAPGDETLGDDAPGGAEPEMSVRQLASGEGSRADSNEVGAQVAFDMDAARGRLDELRLKLDDMGPVNMMAMEELDEAEARFGFLTEQRRDILDSIRLTEDALAEIKRRSRERFRHAFQHINQNFQLMFVELFGGGRGEMILIDEDDILESGIDLIAQPPGKRLQNVLLLSGGEKAMAAIALVLAIFQYRPSPFCILDEVDAPLDEVNVGRFSGKIVEMSSNTQFLIITHNKRTMESARALYGVTMEEPGVSKLVSVKF